MHDFPRLELDDFSKRFILNDTSEADYGRYEADMHVIGGGVMTVEFFVDEYGKSDHKWFTECTVFQLVPSTLSGIMSCNCGTP